MAKAERLVKRSDYVPVVLTLETEEEFEAVFCICGAMDKEKAVQCFSRSIHSICFEDGHFKAQERIYNVLYDIKEGKNFSKRSIK